LYVNPSDGRDETSYLMLFDPKPAGSVFFFFFTRPAREVISRPELLEEASATARAFIGNGANQLYNQGALGATLPNGGDGSAEARYLETVILVQHALMEPDRCALEHLPCELSCAYTPYPDEADHLPRGLLYPRLSV